MGITRYAAPLGIDLTFISFLVDGYANGSSPTLLAPASDSGAIQLRGVKSSGIAQQAARTITQTGDNAKLIWQYVLPPDSGPAGPLAVATGDLDLASKLDGLGTYTDGDWIWSFLSPSNADPKPFTMIQNVRARADDAGSKGEPGYVVFWWFNLQATPRLTGAGLTEATPLETIYDVVASPADQWPTGQAFALGTEGVCDAYGAVTFSDYPLSIHSMAGDGIVVAFDLDYTPAAEDALKVPAWLEGVKETYTTDYAVSGDTVTIVVAPPSTERYVIPYQLVTTGIC